MPDKPAFVVDTNVLISRLLLPRSVAALAVRRVHAEGRLVFSEATLGELADVLARPKFDPYVSVADRKEFLRLVMRTAELVAHVPTLAVCRDPRDDKFLALALAAEAGAIITGDEDLLVLHPFRGIAVLTPAAFVQTGPNSL